jgi:hypothetical protein
MPWNLWAFFTRMEHNIINWDRWLWIRRLILFGDMLTDDMMASVKEHIISRWSDLGEGRICFYSQSGHGTLDPFEWDATHEDAQLVGCYLLVLLRSVFAGYSGQVTLQTDSTKPHERTLLRSWFFCQIGIQRFKSISVGCVATKNQSHGRRWNRRWRFACALGGLILGILWPVVDIYRWNDLGGG